MLSCVVRARPCFSLRSRIYTNATTTHQYIDTNTGHVLTQHTNTTNAQPTTQAVSLTREANTERIDTRTDRTTTANVSAKGHEGATLTTRNTDRELAGLSDLQGAEYNSADTIESKYRRQLIDLMMKYNKENRFQLAINAWEEAEAEGVWPNAKLYATLIQSYIGVGSLKNALDTLQKMKAYHFRLSTALYTTLIGGCRKLKKTTEAWDLFQEMRAFGFKPDTVTYSVLINLFADLKMVAHVRSLLKIMSSDDLQPSIHICARLITMYSQLGDWEASEEILPGLISEKRLDTFITNAAIDMYTNHNQYLKAKDFAEYAIYEAKVPLTLALCNRAIHIYAKLQKSEEASKLLLLMSNKNIQPDIVTYNALISAFLRWKQYKNAEHILERTKKANLCDILTYAAFISHYSQLDNTAQVSKYFQEMKNWGLQPDSMIYHALLEMGTRLQDPMFMVALHTEMQNNSVEVSLRSQKLLYNAYTQLNMPYPGKHVNK